MHVRRHCCVPNTRVPSCLLITIELVHHIDEIVLVVDHLFVFGFFFDLMSLHSKMLGIASLLLFLLLHDTMVQFNVV